MHERILRKTIITTIRTMIIRIVTIVGMIKTTLEAMILVVILVETVEKIPGSKKFYLLRLLKNMGWMKQVPMLK